MRMPVSPKKPIRPKRDWIEWAAWPDSEAARTRARDAGGLVQYADYRLTKRQFVTAALVGGGVVFLAAFLFYRSIPAALVLSAAGIVVPRAYRKFLLEQRKVRLAQQFKEALYSIASSLAAGRSVENAFMTAHEDLKLMYPSPETEIVREFDVISVRLGIGEPLEQVLTDFSRRAGIEDITQFTDVFTTCKRSGGDMVDVIRRTSQMIGEKLEVQQEISVMVAQKRFESRIMMAVPFVFLAFLSLTAPEYMAPLYSGAGYLLLTGALFALGGCYVLMSKIMKIRL
ncbi:pilus assembly protein TadB [Paenibacillus rhizovicinus]|uniref:Pilus assembly protein TadB n=1 Tax=Paenibacillus rhizovicinus TaxID=2704463 RepID=A0A6C0P679_9BACL|nr:type II secretion system F family protein [Paenibacillus rhizovicinus]QHW33213.1 pilus assembly protein TadB [Paenibacillus rhizovicinus]